MATKKTWQFTPAKKIKPTVPESVKLVLQAKADQLIAEVLKPKHIMPPPADQRFNYLADIGSKWYRSYFYFCATYNCPGPTAIATSFETKFTRMEYVGDDTFNLAYMRHTGQWFEVFQGISMDKCLMS